MNVVLITGAARRIGATLARRFHNAGFNVILHYLSSETDALDLHAELNDIRSGSVSLLQHDLVDSPNWDRIRDDCLEPWGRLDVLINNASTFYPSPPGTVDDQMWQDLLGSNLKAPFFLIQALASTLRASSGNIINIVDIHAEKPLPGYSVYGIAKAGVAMLTRSLAIELAPEVRVNGIAPGTILWPEDQASLTESQKTRIIEKIPLKRQGLPDDIAETALFLALNAPYVTGQIIAVDGGRSLKN